MDEALNYNLPLKASVIKKILRGSPLHKGPLSNSIDFMCDEKQEILL